jgi:hypothetical protein
MDNKVFRNEKLKNVISKEDALSLLGLELRVVCEFNGKRISISRDDMYDIFIDEVDADGEDCGLEFEEI